MFLISVTVGDNYWTKPTLHYVSEFFDGGEDWGYL